MALLDVDDRYAQLIDGWEVGEVLDVEVGEVLQLLDALDMGSIVDQFRDELESARHDLQHSDESDRWMAEDDVEACLAQIATMEGDDRAAKWDLLLERKVEHENYDDIVDSIAEHGFTRPLTAFRDDDGDIIFGDGCHRLAAARELGIESVPILLVTNRRDAVASDSGWWRAGDPVA
ncbi:ParB N-terminal domain-containing protein [Agromyces humi]|uniref:ParB N-terminal domain-containing protein n=1 Tax=Agromyces humi TaxID=1766800 RepID=UPI001359683F|nr:ParB N-terminal domain-containing protein [Agromyces humi]